MTTLAPAEQLGLRPGEHADADDHEHDKDDHLQRDFEQAPQQRTDHPRDHRDDDGHHRWWQLLEKRRHAPALLTLTVPLALDVTFGSPR